MSRKNKRGISPLISTVLLVGFVVALLIIVMLWGKSYVQEIMQKRGALAEKQSECIDVKISVTSLTTNPNLFRIVITNEKDRDIGKFTFRVMGDKDEVSESFTELESLAVKEYEVPFSEDTVGAVKSVDIIPWLKVVRGHYVPCSKQHIIAKIGDYTM